MTRWPGGGRDYAGRWPGHRSSRAPVEPPAWFRVFVVEDWVRPGDEEVRHRAGALMGVERVAYVRWVDARREWATEHGMSIADWLAARHEARRRRGQDAS